MTPVLEIQDLSLRLSDQTILREISLQVSEGERWSIIGANGAGKSSLLKCLMRLHGHWEGQVRLYGQDLRGFSQRELARRVAYVAQPGHEAPPAFTARQFVNLGRYAFAGPFGAANAGDAEAVEQALARTGLGSLAERTMDTLSGGECQKVHLAAALAQQAPILLLDEPTAFLDYRHQTEVAAILGDVNRNCGSTIISVTHDVNTALATGGMVLALAAGRVVWSGSTEDLADPELLHRIYQARFRLLDDPATGRPVVVPAGAAGEGE